MSSRFAYSRSIASRARSMRRFDSSTARLIRTLTRLSRSNCLAGTGRRCPIEALRQGPQMVDQLRRLVNRDVHAEHGDPHCKPSEVVVAGAVLAGAVIDRLERSPV